MLPSPEAPQDSAPRSDPFTAGIVAGYLAGFATGYRVGETPTTADLDLRAEAESETFEEGQPREVWTERACTYMAERLLREEVRP